MQSKQIKSRKRVKDHAEVFTAEREVKAMCDLIPLEVWQNIESTFLEASCGNGNFLVEIFQRKLNYCRTESDGIKAMQSIVGIDIQQDNVEESRERLRKLYLNKFPLAKRMKEFESVLKKNIFCADSLEWMKKQSDDYSEQLSMF